MKKTTKWEFIKPFMTPLGVAGGNYVYHIGKSYFSYNPHPNYNIIGEMLGIEENEETAFYDAQVGDFVILLGDFRDEISEREINTREEALDFCKGKFSEYGSPTLTTHDDFTTLYREEETK